MSDVETVLYDRLSGYAGLTALISTRVYPGILPQNPTYPCVSYEVASESVESGLTQDHGMARPRIQVNCFATTYAAAAAIGTQVRAALKRWSDSSTSPEILDSFLDNRLGPFFEAEAGVYHGILDFIVWHRE